MERFVRSFSIISVFSLFSFASQRVYAQGCSDAGFCTIGSLNAQKEDSIELGHKISFLLPLGIGDESVFVFTPAIQYDHQLSERWAIQAKITANYSDGNLGNAFGLGDLFFSGLYTIKSKKKMGHVNYHWHETPNELWKTMKSEGRSLPMQYQSSLGTIDMISGISIGDNSWQFAIGWQQPLSGANGNNFLHEDWQDTPKAEKYPPSNGLNRKGDVLLRTAYTIPLKKIFSFTPGLLAIYHLDDDTYIDANVSNNPISITGSRGLTLNMTLAGSWTLSNKLVLGFSAGAPLVFRDVRPDGLTRKIVFAPEIRLEFLIKKRPDYFM